MSNQTTNPHVSQQDNNNKPLNKLVEAGREGVTLFMMRRRRQLCKSDDKRQQDDIPSCQFSCKTGRHISQNTPHKNTKLL
jgi:hypothetical protein